MLRPRLVPPESSPHWCPMLEPNIIFFTLAICVLSPFRSPGVVNSGLDASGRRACPSQWYHGGNCSLVGTLVLACKLPVRLQAPAHHRACQWQRQIQRPQPGCRHEVHCAIQNFWSARAALVPHLASPKRGLVGTGHAAAQHGILVRYIDFCTLSLAGRGCRRRVTVQRRILPADISPTFSLPHLPSSQHLKFRLPG